MPRFNFTRQHNHDQLANSLNSAVKAAGIAARPDFAEIVQQVCINLIFIDRRNGLVARVRKTAEQPVGAIEANLRAVREASERGAPILPPILINVLTCSVAGQSYVISLWPLADNRLVTPREMASVLHGIHDTQPPDGLPSWIDVRHGNTRQKARALRQLDNPPPNHVIDECIALADESLDILENMVAQAGRSLLHGDAHPANIVIFRGKPVAIDMDEFSVGPPEADLSLTFVHSERYPGMDPTAGEKLAAAFGRPYDEALLRAMVRARTVSKLVSLGRAWSEPGASENLLQRLEVIRGGGKFAKLYGPESLCEFAS